MKNKAYQNVSVNFHIIAHLFCGKFVSIPPLISKNLDFSSKF